MDIPTVSQIKAFLTNCENKEDENTITAEKLDIQVIWSLKCVEATVRSVQNEFECTIDKNFSIAENNCSKELFLKILTNDIKIFALLNINFAINVSDCDSSTVIFKTESCQTLLEKLANITKLKKQEFFEVLMPEHNSKLYFYATPADPDQDHLENTIITMGEQSSAASNSLSIGIAQMIDDSHKISFFGKIDDENHKTLKIVIDRALTRLSNRIETNAYSDANADVVYDSQSFVDLTTTKIDTRSFEFELIEPNDDIFYDLNTSEILEATESMDVDVSLENFYDSRIQGLAKGWDRQIDMNLYVRFGSYDKELMMKFFNEAEEHGIVEIDDDDEDVPHNRSLPVAKSIPIAKSKRTFGRISPYSRKSDFEKIPISRSSKSSELKIKSKLLDQDEARRWKQAKEIENNRKISDIVSNGSSTSLMDESLSGYKIPKKIYSGPSPRPPIHEIDKIECRNYNKEMENKRLMAIFDSKIRNLQPYSSPGCPDSVSSFIDVSREHGEDENNNNNKNVSSVLQKSGTGKRRLYTASPTSSIEPLRSSKFFKSRTPTGEQSHFNPFVKDKRKI